MTDYLMDDLTEARKQVKLAPVLTLDDHEYAHERGICVDSCPFCEENRRSNMSNEFDRPIDMSIGPMTASCTRRGPIPILSREDIEKAPLTLQDPSPTALDLTLNERGANYGDYDNMAYVAQKIKDVLRGGGAWSKTSPAQRESLDLIATKMARIVCGNPNLPDSWLDIEGYAKLARERVPVFPAIP